MYLIPKSLNQRIVDSLNMGPNARRFKKFCREYKSSPKIGNGVILVEQRYWADSFVSLLNFLPAAIDYFGAKPVVYEMLPANRGWSFKRKIHFLFSPLRSIAKLKFWFVGVNPDVTPAHYEIIKLLTSSNTSKSEFENFIYRDILIGDLIYDFFMRKREKVTLINDDPSLAPFISQFLQFCDLFIEYFQVNNVKAVIVSHPVYYFGIPARVAIHRNVPAFLVDIRRCTRIDKRSPYAYNSDWIGIKETFGELSPNEATKARELAKQRVRERIKGNTKDLIGGRLSKYGADIEISPSDLNNGRPKVLVALHDFYDACHRYGNSFYPDFYEWVWNVCNLSKYSNFDWLLKPHPWALRDTHELLNKLKQEFPHIKLIPSNTKNAELVRQGLKFCVTVHGHIAEELPHEGVVVINSSINNPFSDFEFSLTPKNVTEFESLITRLESLKFTPNLDSLYEYYYVQYFHRLRSWIVPDYAQFVQEVGTLRAPLAEKVYSIYLSSANKVSVRCANRAVKNFLTSSEFLLERKHYDSQACDDAKTCQCRSMNELSYRS